MSGFEKITGILRQGLDETRLATLRIGSGLVLFVYVTTHLLNHALGLISIDAMEQGSFWFKLVWRSWPFTIVLYGAITVHFVAALYRLYVRRSLKMRWSEAVQIALGLAIPFLMVVHVVGTRYAHQVHGINDSYTYVLLSTFVFSPISGWINAAGLVVAWLHGCMGMQFWLKLKPWYKPLHFNVGLFLATLLPCLALAGYLAAGREVIPLSTDGEFMGNYYENLNLSSDAVWGMLGETISWVRWTLVAVLLAFVLGRLGRYVFGQRNKEIQIDYVDGPQTTQPVGSSLLEMSKLGGIPHASVCGGRGRCSTCRVRVIESAGPLLSPSEGERKVLERVRAPEDVRLACQIYPKDDLKIIRLLPSDASVGAARNLAPFSTGRERVITVMFADLRDFTKTSESRLPFDVVYLINQFSKSMGVAVERHGGRIDKFLGDGFMALFGLDVSSKDAARSAIAAADDMMKELVILNERLANDLDEPLRMGIGIHSGSVILGDMGYGTARSLTAIGDTVNIASRLEAATKAEKCVFCLSISTLEQADAKFPPLLSRQIAIRGKSEKLDILALKPEDMAQLQLESHDA